MSEQAKMIWRGVQEEVMRHELPIRSSWLISID